MINIHKLIGAVAFWFGWFIILNYHIHNTSILTSAFLTILVALNIALLSIEKETKEK